MANRNVGDQVSSFLPGTKQREEYKEDPAFFHHLKNDQPERKGVGSGTEAGSKVPFHTSTLGGSGGSRQHIPGLPIHTVEDQKVTGVPGPKDHTGTAGHVDYLGGREGFTGTTAHDPWNGQSAHVGAGHVPTSTKILSHIPGTQANKAKKAGLLDTKPGSGQRF